MKFLQDDSDPGAVTTALTLANRDWVRREARAGVGEVCQESGMVWVYIPGVWAAIVEWPDEAEAALLDKALNYYRVLGVPRVSCTIRTESPNAALKEQKLNAAGFEPVHQGSSWWLDIKTLFAPEGVSRGVCVEAINEFVTWAAADVPYFDSDSAPRMHRLTSERPQRVWYYWAWLDGAPVGHCMTHLASGPSGIVTIQYLGVAPQARGRGVARALAAAACTAAAAPGCRYAAVNPSDEGIPVYRKLGFRELSYTRSQLYWLSGDKLQDRRLGA